MTTAAAGHEQSPVRSYEHIVIKHFILDSRQTISAMFQLFKALNQQ
jgi:hypothetical protein